MRARVRGGVDFFYLPGTQARVGNLPGIASWIGRLIDGLQHRLADERTELIGIRGISVVGNNHVGAPKA